MMRKGLTILSNQHPSFGRLAALFLLTFAVILSSALARSPKSAQITRTVHEVSTAHGKSQAQPAQPNDPIGMGDEVQTGPASAAEMNFADKTIVRLGSNSRFALDRDGRGFRLAEGSLFLQVPKGAAEARINIFGAVASVKATTALCEYHGGVYKFLVLQGIGRIYRPGHFGDSVLVRPGQMAIGKPEAPVSNPVDFDIGRFLKTSRFIVNCPPLGSAALMARESEKQERQKLKRVLIETNLVIFGGGTQVSLLDPGKPREGADPADSPAPAAKPAPAIDPAAVDQAMSTRK